MLRALYSAASGMIAQQANVETVSNNLANVNTTGFKKGRAEFQDMLYAQVQAPVQGVSGGVALGQGVRLSSIQRVFAAGNLQVTGSPLDLAIQGGGFFRIQRPDGSHAFTRDGAFRLDGKGNLTTSAGDVVLGDKGPITLPIDAKNVAIGPDGTIIYTDPKGQSITAGRLSLAVFANPDGLVAQSENRWDASAASGEPQASLPGGQGAGHLAQGYLESSNVEVAEEMVNLMQAQRAYQLNSRVIHSADEMMSMANNLRRG